MMSDCFILSSDGGAKTITVNFRGQSKDSLMTYHQDVFLFSNINTSCVWDGVFMLPSLLFYYFLVQKKGGV